MNLILLDSEELHDGRTTLRERRARHVRKVLRSKVGDQVRVGLINGPQGTATIRRIQVTSVELELDGWTSDGPEPGHDVLMLAIARPKVLMRCLEHAAALGFGRIALFRSKRVDKNHLESTSLGLDACRQRLVLGLEQARRTHLPELSLHRYFEPFANEAALELATRSNRFVTDPDAPVALAASAPTPEPFSLVIGPEGGLLDFEIETFERRGFQPVNVGRQPLRVESALSFITGQLMALRQRIESKSHGEQGPLIASGIEEL